MDPSPSLFVHTGSIDDEESIENRIGNVDKPLQSHFHTSKFNKNLYPSGFVLESSRSERFLRDEKDNENDNGNQISARSGCSQLTNFASTRVTPKTSFMYWASGEPTETQFDHYKMKISEAICASPYSAGV